MSHPSPLRRLYYKYLSLHLPWRRKFLAGHDLEGNLYFTMRQHQSSGRERRMVQYREKKDWASYTLTPQWQAWLRHSRREVPSVEELIADLQRRERMKVLAKRADERWIAGGIKAREGKLAIGSSEDALKAVQGGQPQKSGEDDGPPTAKRDLPAQDPGSTFQPQQWSGKAIKRE